MADNIKDWTISWILIGFFALAIISFSTSFIIYNGGGNVFSEDSRINDTIKSLTESLTGINETAEKNKNLTAQYNPELAGFGGDKVQVGQGLNILGLLNSIFQSIRIFIYYSFGESGLLFILVGTSILMLITTYYLIKFFRNIIG